MELTKEQQEELELHIKWKRGENGGKQIRWRYKNLQGADLQGADLQGADLQGAYLQGYKLKSNIIQLNGACCYHCLIFLGEKNGETCRVLQISCKTFTLTEWNKIAKDEKHAERQGEGVKVQVDCENIIKAAKFLFRNLGE